MKISRSTKRKVVFYVIFFSSIYLGYRNRYDLASWMRNQIGWHDPVDPRPEGMSKLEWAERNYSEEVLSLSKKYEVPYEYLMALIVLECGGDKPAGNRYESHIYSKLTKLKDSKIKRLEDLKPHHVAECNENALKNLATSWGPFQLMGYKVVGMGLNISDIRHETTAIEIGVRWIEKEYGHFLKKKKFRDGFHYHNTGSRFPISGKSRTHDPYYVSNGLKYMKWYKARKK
ncbi:MAG: hypothetical protein SGI87_03410 [Flavobacteriales bacterium]|nr:hypothetical protein [Flavobacteriales bacterium]